MKPKVCKYCKETFTPERQFQNTCSLACAIARGKERVKAEVKRDKRKAVKEFKENDKSHLMKIAQQVVNRYVRLRDKNEPCISCQRPVGYRQEAGHYMSAGGNAHVRFDENNIHSQCHVCNCHQSANLVKYRKHLIKKIGIEEVERLERKEVRSFTIDELKDIIEIYKTKYKELSDEQT